MLAARRTLCGLGDPPKRLCTKLRQINKFNGQKEQGNDENVNKKKRFNNYKTKFDVRIKSKIDVSWKRHVV